MRASATTRTLAQLAAVALAGTAIGLATFSFTSTHRAYIYLGPLCATHNIQTPGFNPWTGDPQGRIYVCDRNFLGGGSSAVASPIPVEVVASPVPVELVGRKAIPVPVGFAVGSSVSAPIVFWLDRRRRRRPARRGTRVVPTWAVVLNVLLIASAAVLTLYLSVESFYVVVVAQLGILLWLAQRRRSGELPRTSITRLSTRELVGTSLLTLTCEMVFLVYGPGPSVATIAAAAASLSIVFGPSGEGPGTAVRSSP
jgi:hypothetical protein